MKTYLLPILVVSVALCACEKKEPTVIDKPTPATSNFETSRLGHAIDAYQNAPTAENVADVDRAFAELDQEIAELKQQASTQTGAPAKTARTKEDNLRAYRAKEEARFLETKARAKAQDLKADAKGVGQSLKEAGETTGEALKDAGNTVKEGFEKAADTVKDAMP